MLYDGLVYTLLIWIACDDGGRRTGRHNASW